MNQILYNALKSDNIPNLLFYIPETVILISADIVTIESTLSKKEIEELFTSTQDFNSTKSDIEDIPCKSGKSVLADRARFIAESLYLLFLKENASLSDFS